MAKFCHSSVQGKLIVLNLGEQKKTNENENHQFNDDVFRC